MADSCAEDRAAPETNDGCVGAAFEGGLSTGGVT
jgi:hypothetical protein